MNHKSGRCRFITALLDAGTFNQSLINTALTLIRCVCAGIQQIYEAAEARWRGRIMKTCSRLYYFIVFYLSYMKLMFKVCATLMLQNPLSAELHLNQSEINWSRYRSSGLLAQQLIPWRKKKTARHSGKHNRLNLPWFHLEMWEQQPAAL